MSLPPEEPRPPVGLDRFVLRNFERVVAVSSASRSNLATSWSIERCVSSA